MITPTIGRRVWYWPTQEDKQRWTNEEYRYSNQPWDAGIIFVQSDVTVNLDVTSPSGDRVFREFCMLGDTPTPGCASWMPYQQKNAESKG